MDLLLPISYLICLYFVPHGFIRSLTLLFTNFTCSIKNWTPSHNNYLPLHTSYSHPCYHIKMGFGSSYFKTSIESSRNFPFSLFIWLVIPHSYWWSMKKCVATFVTNSMIIICYLRVGSKFIYRKVVPFHNFFKFFYVTQHILSLMLGHTYSSCYFSSLTYSTPFVWLIIYVNCLLIFHCTYFV